MSVAGGMVGATVGDGCRVAVGGTLVGDACGVTVDALVGTAVAITVALGAAVATGNVTRPGTVGLAFRVPDPQAVSTTRPPSNSTRRKRQAISTPLLPR